MANTIALAKQYLPLLDKIYQKASVTSVLDVAPALVKAGHNAGSFLIPNITLTGLGDYNRATGYKAGDVGFSWVEYLYSQDRGRALSVDAQDDAESLGLAFGAIAGEFIRTKVVPEVDAFRLAKLASTSGIQGPTAANLADAAAWTAALNTAEVALDDAEVDDTDLVLFITAAGLNLVTNQASTAPRASIIDRATVVKVPSARFVTAITTDPGNTTSAGGWAKAWGAENLNFMLVSKSAVFADAKSTVTRVFAPDSNDNRVYGADGVNQTANQWRFDFRMYHDAWVYSQKLAGVYAHKAAS